MSTGAGSTAASAAGKTAGWIRARKVSEGAGLICLGLILLLTLWYGAALRPFSVAAGTQKTPIRSADAAGNAANNVPPPAPIPSAQAQVEDAVNRATAPLKDEIKAREDQQRAILDRLVTLVGAYSLLVGLTAFFSLKSAREEAQSQTALSRSQLADNLTLTSGQITNHLNSTTDQLKLVQDSAKEQLKQNRDDWAEFKMRIWSELPDMRAMQEGLRALLFDLEHIIPAETNWNDERSYVALSEDQKQEILISESTIAALPTLISRDSTGNMASLARLYRTLARFYFGRYKAEKARTDSGRADAYITRALRIDPAHAGSYRMRGVIYLAEQRLNPMAAGQPDVLLEKAERNLRLAIAKDKNDLGAHYNLALALARAGNPDKTMEGIELTRDVLARLNVFPEPQKRKYIDSVVLNQACDLNAVARTAKDEESKKLRAEAVKTITDGIDILAWDRNARGSESLRAGIEREIAPGKDLHDLPADQKDLLLQYQAPATQPKPAVVI
jgi:hypothetical protein